MRNWSKTDIIRRPVQVLPPLKLPRDSETGLDCRVSARVRVAKPTRVPAGTQRWVTVRTLLGSTFIMEQRHKLYARPGLIAANGLVNTTLKKPFEYLVANLRSCTLDLPKRMIVGPLIRHSGQTTPTSTVVADVRGLKASPAEK